MSWQYMLTCGLCLGCCCNAAFQKPGKQEMKPTELLKVDKERGPTNPMVYPEFEPTELEAAMLRAVLRSYAIKAGSTEHAMEELQAKLKRSGYFTAFLDMAA